MSITIEKPSDYKGVGRPCTLTPSIQNTICQIIAEGNYLVTACAAVGIAPHTLTNWLDKGKAEEEAGETSGRFFAFLQAVKEAEAKSEITLVAEVRKHSASNVIAPLSILDRRFRERWGREPVAQGGGNTYNINIEKAIIDAAGKFDAVVKRLAERAAAPHQLQATDTPDNDGSADTKPGDDVTTP